MRAGAAIIKRSHRAGICGRCSAGIAAGWVRGTTGLHGGGTGKLGCVTAKYILLTSVVFYAGVLGAVGEAAITDNKRSISKEAKRERKKEE